MSRLSYTGAFIIILLIVLAVSAPFITDKSPDQISIKDAYLRPSLDHVFGTDALGRDLFSRMIYATRIALLIGVVAVGLSTFIGIILGSLAGYFGSWMDSIIMRFTDIMLCFPKLFLILSVVAVVGPSIFNIMIVIGLTSWMGVARIIRAEILSLRTREFILASKSLGRSDFYIIVKHLIPNALGPVMINFVFGVAGAILTESGLSFLGLGVQPPDPSWGNILMQGKQAIGYAWWVMLFPGFFIFLTVLSFNLLGEGLREKINPRLRI